MASSKGIFILTGSSLGNTKRLVDGTLLFTGFFGMNTRYETAYNHSVGLLSLLPYLSVITPANWHFISLFLPK
jgi:hypothetical protein